MLLYFILPATIIDVALSWVQSELAAYRNVMLRPLVDEQFRAWSSHVPSHEKRQYREKARAMFYHGFDAYMEHAFPLDELDPIACKGRGPDLRDPGNININDVLGNYSLTLIDSLDTLAIIGDTERFEANVRLLLDTVDFDQPHTVNLFEATIRVLGSLLSVHQLIVDQLYGTFTPYKGEVLDLAENLAGRLVRAFDVTALLPLPRVRLDGSVDLVTANITETTVASVTSLILEFGTLSALTGNATYIELARGANERVWQLRHETTGLFPTGVDSITGAITNSMSGIGAGMDSSLEYMLKSYIMFGDEIDYARYSQVMASIRQHQRMGRTRCFSGDGTVPFYANVEYSTGTLVNNWIDALSAFMPGLLTLAGDIEEAVCLHFLYFSIWRMFDAMPERYNWKLLEPEVLFYPLRPELIESTYHLYRATKSPFYLHAGKELLDALNRNVKTSCGYATLHSVKTRQLEDRMESFFLAETVKYLYVSFFLFRSCFIGRV